MNPALTVALTPLSSLYGLAVSARRALYDQGVLRIHEVPAPVISVGNITAGGTGKTPLVERIANQLAHKNRRVCILARGYARRNSKTRVIVSDGDKVLSTAEHAGDEPFLLAERLKGRAAVISDADRVAAARWATKNLKSDVFILDDGFQNLRIARCLNIVTIDATNPWGNGKLLPAGILRENPNALSRTDAIVITRADTSDKLAELERELKKLSNESPMFRSRMRIAQMRLTQEQAETAEASAIKRSPVAAFCGIGNPESFFTLLGRDGYQLSCTKVFRDHHRYDQADLDRVARESMAAGAHALLTTAKDEVKLRRLNLALPCYAVDIEIEIEDEASFEALINKAVWSAPAERSGDGALDGSSG